MEVRTVQGCGLACGLAPACDVICYAARLVTRGAEVPGYIVVNMFC